MQTTLIVILVLNIVSVILLVFFLAKPRTNRESEHIKSIQGQLSGIDSRFELLGKSSLESTGSFRTEINEGMRRLREQTTNEFRVLREEITSSVSNLGSSITTGLNDFRKDISTKLDTLMHNSTAQQWTLQESLNGKFFQLSESNEKKLDLLRQIVEQKLDQMNTTNASKLDEMRQTVDEKLHNTLQTRLTESFGLVTDQLGRVQTGLGEMKDLATGVGDLKRALTNVKIRGGFAEVQLGLQLEQMFSPSQFASNVKIKPDTRETVEYAIKLPNGENGELLLPIDAKFPKEDWERLEDASVKGDVAGVQAAAKSLEATIRSEAEKIFEKYIYPPVTTNFAVMYLPTEGLFAEVIRRPGLIDELQTKYRVCVAGPTTFMALLTSLQMGFKTLVIQQKGIEVWNILAATKSEFGKFGGLMQKVENQVGTVQKTLSEINKKTGTINRKLRDVETLEMQPQAASNLLGFDELDNEEQIIENIAAERGSQDQDIDR